MHIYSFVDKNLAVGAIKRLNDHTLSIKSEGRFYNSI